MIVLVVATDADVMKIVVVVVVTTDVIVVMGCRQYDL